MKVAIHQPHYFPWLGYMDKMAKVDKFAILDEAQLTERSNMFRNKFLANDGTEKYLTLSYKKENHLNLPFKEIEINSNVDWQKKHKNFILTNYKKAKYFDEIWDVVAVVFEKQYTYLYEVDIDTIMLLRMLLDVNTPLVYQSNLFYDRTKKKNDMVLEICKCLGAKYYLSGNGARKYMEVETFKKERIAVEYQNFMHPQYEQLNGGEFQPCMSALDLLFNNGIEKSRKIFWDNVKKGKEFEGEER